MERIQEELNNQLISKIGFTIPLFGGIPVPQTIVISWIVMAILVGFSIIFVRNLKLVPTGVQIYVEALIGGLNNFFGSIMGIEGKPFFPYLETVVLYLAFSNIMGIFGLTPPTKDLNVTAGLAIMSILLVLGAGIKAKGIKAWLHHFAEPMPLLLPINILEIFIRPLSLCMRLFGNILGAFVVMELIKIVVPIIVPIPLSLYFDIFDGLIQAIVFVFLTSLFLQEAIE